MTQHGLRQVDDEVLICIVATKCIASMHWLLEKNLSKASLTSTTEKCTSLKDRRAKSFPPLEKPPQGRNWFSTTSGSLKRNPGNTGHLSMTITQNTLLKR